MMFSQVELVHIYSFLSQQLAFQQAELLKLDEDSDEYMERRMTLWLSTALSQKLLVSLSKV